MSTRSVRTLTFVASFGAFTSALAQQGTITGKVTDAATGHAVAAAQVGIVGTALGAQTSDAGVYTVRGITAGRVEVRVLRIGFVEQREAVTVVAGQTVTLDFKLKALAINLDPVVTTATGQQRRVEVGNAIARVDAVDLVQTRAVSNMGDLLVSRAPGVTVFEGVQTGAGTRIRIRGTSSLSLSNNPIFVIDGIRVEGTTGSSSVSVGGTTPARIGDINPEEIESVEVVRGPSAATLYGTDAANGVIVITTKRGTAGRRQWTQYTEQTAITDQNKYPTAFWGWRTGTTSATTSSPSNTVQCFLSQVAAGTCVQDSVTHYNLHDDPQSTPYGVGYRKQYGSQLSGGSDVLRYFVSGEFEDEDGVTKVPQFDERYMAAHARSLRPEQESPNRLTRMSGRSNVNISITQDLDLGVSAGYISEDIRLPRSDDSGVSGIAANTYGGPGFKYNMNSAGDTLYGWRQFTARDVYQAVTNQAIERLIGSASPNWRPQEWLAFNGNFGIDLINRDDTQLCRFANCPNVGEDRLGFKTDNRANFFIYTVNLAGTATRRLSSTLESKTILGAQVTRNMFTRNGATGLQLPPGATTVSSGAIKQADETTSDSRTIGSFLEEDVAFQDRIFLTGAVRSDRNSAFGADFKTALYPKFSASWIASQEGFFPKWGWLDQLRLRTAYGASGVQPGTIDAVQFFTSTSARGESGDQPALVFSALGNRKLKPEKSTEVEVGFDMNLFRSRLTAEVTHYSKKSRDALISRILPPSLGTGATARLENLGEVRNSGWEALVSARVLQSNRLDWDVSINGSTNNNELASLGGVPPIIGTTQSQKVGYPLNGWWSRALLGFNDRNHNGIIEYSSDTSKTEITVSDTAMFLGYPLPRREVSLVNTFDLFRRRLQISAMVDYKGGHLTYNNTERIRCASRFNCAGLISPKSSLFQQARTVMVREHPSRSVSGFFEKGDFVRFRELNVSYNPPTSWAEKIFRARNMTATFALRNVHVPWTRYSGVDPEAFGTTGDAPSEFQAFGPPTYYAFRFIVNY